MVMMVWNCVAVQVHWGLTDAVLVSGCGVLSVPLPDAGTTDIAHKQLGVESMAREV